MDAKLCPMLEAKGRLVNRPTQASGKTYDRLYVSIPAAVAQDSAFPLRVGDEVVVRIDSGRKALIVTKT